jgi:tricorn protease
VPDRRQDCPQPLEIDGGVQGMIKQDGSTLAFNRMGGSYWRKGYKGNRPDDVWTQDLKTKKITRLTDTELKDYRNFTQDVYPMWGQDGMIYFSSSGAATFNIYRIAATGGAPQQVTSHTDDGVQFPVDEPGRHDHRLREQLRGLDAEGRPADARRA